MVDLTALMDDFFETTAYDKEGARWQDTAATFIDPDVEGVQKFDADQLRDAWGRWTEDLSRPQEYVGGKWVGERGKYVKPVSPLANAFHLMALRDINNLPKDMPVDQLVGTLGELAHSDRLTFVHNVGKVMQVETTDKPMTAHRCYNNSLDVMLQEALTEGTRTTQYVEGYVTEHGIPLAHAWNKNGDKYVDHTIGSDRSDKSRQYIGMVIPRKVIIPVASSGAFGKGRGEGIIGTILAMKQTKKRDEYLRLINEANP